MTAKRLLAFGLVLLAIAVALAVYPSNEYIFLPDKAHPVAPLVTVQGGHDAARGGIYFVDVVVRKATVLERLFGGLHKGADLYPASAINPPGVNDTLRRKIDLEDMQRSQQFAAAVALEALHRSVRITPTGALPSTPWATGEPAVGKSRLTTGSSRLTASASRLPGWRLHGDGVGLTSPATPSRSRAPRKADPDRAHQDNGRPRAS